MIAALALVLAVSAPAGARLDLRTSPLVDLHFWVRALAEADAPGERPAPVLAAVAAAKALDADLGGSLGWGPIEGVFAGCASAADAVAAAAELPESFDVRPGKAVALRERASELARLLAAAEPAFLESTWPAHRDAIESVRARIESEFLPKSGACLERVAADLGLEPGDLEIPVVLVAEAPFPGAVTQRARGGRGVCFVGVRSAEGTQLFETILHEATHALDVASKGGGVLGELRKGLEDAGLTRRDRAWRDVPHTLMFVEAGETIRRLVDPEHRHYGVVSGYYDKVRAVADLELEAWVAHLDGKATRAEAVARILAGATAK